MSHIDDLKQKLAYLEQSDALRPAADEVRAELATLEPKKRKPSK